MSAAGQEFEHRGARLAADRGECAAARSRRCATRRPGRKSTSATFSAGPRAKPNRSMVSSPSVRCRSACSAAVLAQAARRRRMPAPSDGARGRGAAGDLARPGSGAASPALPHARRRQSANRSCPCPRNPGSEQPRQPCPDSIGKLVPPFHLSGRAGVVGGRSLAAELVEAPAVARSLVVEGLGEFSLVVERPPIAAVVDGVAEEDLGAPMLVQIRNLARCVTNCSSVPVITSGMGGQPETLMMGLSPTMADTGHASVGFGSAKGMPPKAEQVPTQTMAAAPLAASRRMSTALRPPAVQ